MKPYDEAKKLFEQIVPRGYRFKGLQLEADRDAYIGTFQRVKGKPYFIYCGVEIEPLLRDFERTRASLANAVAEAALNLDKN